MLTHVSMSWFTEVLRVRREMIAKQEEEDQRRREEAEAEHRGWFFSFSP